MKEKITNDGVSETSLLCLMFLYFLLSLLKDYACLRIENIRVEESEEKRLEKVKDLGNYHLTTSRVRRLDLKKDTVE